jgi:hypothetical protein
LEALILGRLNLEGCAEDGAADGGRGHHDLAAGAKHEAGNDWDYYFFHTVNFFRYCVSLLHSCFSHVRGGGATAPLAVLAVLGFSLGFGGVEAVPAAWPGPGAAGLPLSAGFATQ